MTATPPDRAPSDPAEKGNSLAWTLALTTALLGIKSGITPEEWQAIVASDEEGDA